MMTNEKVLSVFKEYIASDAACEVILTSRGYVVMEWETQAHEWSHVQHCETPEDLREALLNMYRSYRANIAVENSKDGELSDGILEVIENESHILSEKCG